MCGIAGFVQLTGAPPEGRAILERMTGVIRHRGPDDSGFYCEGRAFLGHRRLSIIDVAAGHQPMRNETGQLWVVYNGEIFNHSGLRPELEQAGHAYASRCDTETILHAYEQYGPDCVNRFRGMFAFAVWDAEKQQLFCARDRLGKKPFYYFCDGRVFVFGSEIKALLEHPAVTPEAGEEVLSEYLAFGYISSERTLFRNIRKLMPGHWLTLDAGTGCVRTRQYWTIPEPPEIPEQRSDEDWIAECRTRLEETVRMRLMSDVPLGMFLSGGVDSSAIAALMTRMVPGPVKTFAVGYSEEAYSELSYARQVANRIGTDHRDVVVGMEDFFNALPRLIWHEDEPITWPSSVSLHFVSKLAAEDVKVVLTGEGSDELFAGYYRYRHYLWNRRWMDRYRMVPGAVRSRLRTLLTESGIPAADLRRKLQHTFIGRDDSVESLFVDNFYSAFGGDAHGALFSVPAHDTYAGFLRYWNAPRRDTALSRMLFADQKTYLVELLMKQDQMSMSASLESRVPFLDHEFVEFAWRMPDHMKLRGRTGKYVLKRAVEDLLPRDIIYRPKMGFPTPVRDWFRQARSEPLIELLQEKDGLLAGITDRVRLAELIDRHRRGVEDATDRLWRLLNLQVWADVFITGKRDRHWDGLFRSVVAGSAA